MIEKRSGKPQLDEMGYLLHSPVDRAGPLGFGLNAEPPAPKRRYEGFRLPIEEATGP